MDPNAIAADEELRNLVEAGEDAVAYHHDATALDYQVIFDAVRYFVSQGGDIVRSGALTTAVSNGDFNMIQVFAWQNPSCLEELDDRGRTALMIAATLDVRNYLQWCADDPAVLCLDLLSLKVNVHQEDNHGRRACDYAIAAAYKLTENVNDFRAAIDAIQPLLDLLKGT